jgi:hypothetical protein
MLAKFQKFANYIKPDDKVTLKIFYQNYVSKERKIINCRCKKESLQVRISTDCMKFVHEICICCKEQYEFMLKHLPVQPQHLMIELSKNMKLNKLLLLNDREWHHVAIFGNIENYVENSIFEYLPKMRYLSWESDGHLETLKAAFYLLQNNRQMEFVRIYGTVIDAVGLHLNTIGIKIPEMDTDNGYAIYIQKDTLKIFIFNNEMLIDEEEEVMYQEETIVDYEFHETDVRMQESDLVFSVQYDYEDLNL